MFDLHILTIAVLFAVLYILFEKIKNIRTEKMLLVLVTVLYAFTAVIQTPDVWFCTGMVLLLTFTFSYAFEPEACTDIDMDNTAHHLYCIRCPFCVVYGWLYSIAGACL